ncbi:MAG: radical SAM family heme chaperone HemW [Caldilineaceae bacterium]|nr:radical SAM family heme chaperone HemW [Caldilineaceae bacterium]
MSNPHDAFGLYVHIPFCEKKCPYCDFNTYAGLEQRFASTVDALCREMTLWAPRLAGQPVTSVFIGGGTPTVLDEALLARLLEQIHTSFQLTADCEITSEANPGTVDRRKFRLLHDLGVTRISLGVQSFQPEELRFLGRIHDGDDACRAVDAARSAGFANINLDFIFGLPNQRPEAWLATLEQALTLEPEHLSLYSLIVEPETPLYHWVQTGRVPAPDEENAADHYELAMARLAAAGYRHYEVSNWARDTGDDAVMPDRACRHNLVYWRNQAYLGIGPGAHSHMTLADPAGGRTEQRWGNHKPVPGYVRRVMAGETVTAFHEVIDPRLSMGETMMLGLRLVEEGVEQARFQQRYGQALEDMFAPELAYLVPAGAVTVDEKRIRLTRRGLMVGNQVFARFLPSD